MKLKKILLASATVAAFSAVMSISALAANTITPEYTPATATKTAVVTVADAPVFTDGSSYTMLILNTNNGAVLTTIANTDIKQIGEEPVTYKNVEIPVGDLTAGATYEVRMGGDGNLWTGTFTVPKATPDNPYYTDGTTLLGDANLNGEIAGNDAMIALDYTVGVKDVSKDVLQALDVNDNGEIAGNDAMLILDYTVGDRTVIGTKTIAEKTNFVPVTATN